MDAVSGLTAAQSILLAASLSSDSSIHGLQELLSIKSDIFDLELSCRLILTFLPESLDPSLYTGLLDQLASSNPQPKIGHAALDLSVVGQLPETEARQQLKSLRLLPLKHPSILNETDCDTFTQFLIHRSLRIDAETGLLPLVPKLIAPFLNHSQHLSDWYVANCVPLLRLHYDYYPVEEPDYTLESFQSLHGAPAITALLAKPEQAMLDGYATSDTTGRDLRGIVAPFVQANHLMRGRKRKRSSPETYAVQSQPIPEEAPPEWQDLNEWVVSAASSNLSLAVYTFEGWSGPSDMDLGLPEELYHLYQFSPETANMLLYRFCQAGFASVYIAEQDTPETITNAHSILKRLAVLLDFVPPPDLATSVKMLPPLEDRAQQLESNLITFLQRDLLLQPDNPLTTPNLRQFSLLQVLLRSAYLLANLGYTISVLKVAKLRFSSEDGEQLRLAQRIMHGLIHGQSRAEHRWQETRDTMIWLWDWDITEQPNSSTDGYGVFGKIERSVLETELLKAFCAAGQYDLVKQTYLSKTSAQSPLPHEAVEEILVALALQYYDNASNGNKTRGGVKKAVDILAAFRTYFAHSPAFRRVNNLISATHALSFYSLRLQPGVPFQPGLIRSTEDPLSLIEKVLEQNTNAYTKLDDLIEIGCNLVRASYGKNEEDKMLTKKNNPQFELDEATELLIAERRVISMAIESALNSNDFETAYSYVVNRLQAPISSSDDATATSPVTDDVSWRAALLAGSYRSPAVTRTANAGAIQSRIRGLEQRMELLSHALQLAPPRNLPGVLDAWRKVEEVLLAVLAQESDAAQEFDEQADRGQFSTPAPGAFGGQYDADGRPSLIAQPRRKEAGRGGLGEAPMGLFDVARGAAAAFSRTTSGSLPGASPDNRFRVASADSVDSSGRQRKRDMVANAVTGRLASGLGWVLGATPVKEEDR